MEKSNTLDIAHNLDARAKELLALVSDVLDYTMRVENEARNILVLCKSEDVVPVVSDALRKSFSGEVLTEGEQLSNTEIATAFENYFSRGLSVIAVGTAALSNSMNAANVFCRDSILE